MPRITNYDWEHDKRKQKRAKSFILVAATGLILFSTVISAIFLISAPKASALGSIGPDPADFGGQTMSFVVDNTAFVGANTTDVMLYFKNSTGNSVTVNSAGLADSPAFDTFYSAAASSGSNGANVTSYDLVDRYTNTVMATKVATKGTSQLVFTANFPATTPVDVDTGYYTAMLVANVTAPPKWVYHNGFSIQLSGVGDVVGFDSRIAANKFAMSERLTDNAYTQWNLKFGADCSILPPSGAPAKFTYFDPDNNDVNVQPKQESFRIMDMTAAPTVVPLTVVAQANPGGDDFLVGAKPAVLDTATNTVTPGDNSKTTGTVEFNALPGHIYQVEIYNVYSYNTLQFQLPFDSIFYQTKGCQAPAYTITPTLLVVGGATTIARGNPPTIINAIATADIAPTKPFTMSVAQTGPFVSLSPSPTSWDMPAFTVGGVSQQQSFSVTVPNGVSDGAKICFENTVDPGMWTQATGYLTTKSAKLCLTVIGTRYPSVQGFSGDIHAGGGLCLPGTNILKFPGTNGSVTGNPSSNSYGQYVVSASGGINNFGSAGVPGSPTLSLGSAGGYTQVCRQDLLTAAETNRPAGANVIANPFPAAVDVSGMSGVWYYDGIADLNITGIVGASLTIVKTNAAGGVVRIVGDVSRNNTYNYTAATLPSLGIISATDIVIAASVQQVDAYLFANGDIDTCAEGQSGNPIVVKLCGNFVLTVNGFLMAKTIAFRRLGTANGQGPVPGEIVNLSPHIYLNPPKFFDSSVESTLGEGQGERQPLF